MPLTRLSTRIAVALVVAVSFAVLFARGRPVGGLRTIEPVLYASGLTQPRGLAFGADGMLYLAEAGLSGPGERPIAGRISRFEAREQQAILIDGVTPATTIQPLFAQGGPAGLVRGQAQTVPVPAPFVLSGTSAEAPLGRLGRLSAVGDQWKLDVVLAFGDGAGGSPASPWGAAIAPDGGVFTALPLANQLNRLQLGPAGTSGGPATTVTGFLDTGQRNPLPAGVAVGADGGVLVALFGAEPFRAGGGRIVQVEPDGRWRPIYESLSFPIALAHAPDGQLYALEFSSSFDSRSGSFAPRSGRLIAVGAAPGRRRVVVDEINYPTALTFSPGGDAFLTENGALSGAGAGRILQVPGQSLRTLR
jgi:hypothetical protein